ncbi:uncharacterized protein BDCG_08474 [Blastomyces dermatitidis ER-3]|uniref:Uncharacterized protein n=1 Tax=Ajellomyces dermatitidis (strain ER-3 / ATCC MYA-2586) TaxID=559297 RepID=A0ABP2EPS0_AJEDR|nr:uncharacterized protein BDCG_08474 [Blastomyces dermatitidis ER-3]EEQ85205.2 hypothetical protein BDCG_08474 [Blastomyces dermatitidis ER-3]
MCQSHSSPEVFSILSPGIPCMYVQYINIETNFPSIMENQQPALRRERLSRHKPLQTNEAWDKVVCTIEDLKLQGSVRVAQTKSVVEAQTSASQTQKVQTIPLQCPPRIRSPSGFNMHCDPWPNQSCWYERIVL